MKLSDLIFEAKEEGDIKERKLICHEYIDAIKNIEEFTGMGIYNLDKARTELHAKLCKLFNLTTEQTKKYTDNIDLRNSRAPEILYLALSKESKKDN